MSDTARATDSRRPCGAGPTRWCLRDDREGASRGLQHDAANFRRGTPHRRRGPEGVDFRNTILIMTSNVGSRAAAIRAGGLQHPLESSLHRRRAAGRVPQGAGKRLRAGVLNRIRRDRRLPARSTRATWSGIVELELEGLFRPHLPAGLQRQHQHRRRSDAAGAGGGGPRYGVGALTADDGERPAAAPLPTPTRRGGPTRGTRCVVVESDKARGVRLRVA